MTTTDTENTAIAIVVPEREQLPPSLLANIETGFREAFAQAEKWRVQALAINVTSADQKTEMQLARTMRLGLKKIRVDADKTREKLKADSLRMGKAIQGVYNLLEAAIVPLEKHLEEQEQYGERLAEAERQATLARRTAELASYLTEGQQVPALDVMSAEQFANYLTDAKLLHEAKIEQARKAEAERIAAEQAAAAERERLRIENEKLRQEVAEREAAAKAEREAAERELARIKAESEAAAKKEREAAAERQRIADEAARKEREDAQREIERVKAEAAAAAEKDRKERAKLESGIAAQKAAEEAAAKAAAAAQKKAARAPDKQKALTFAATVRTLKAPTATTEEGKAVMAEITAKIEGFAKWITVQAESL